MPDGGNVSKGQKIDGNFSASEWNDVRKRDRKQALTPVQQDAPDGSSHDGIVQVLVQNEFKAGDIVSLSTPPIVPPSNLSGFQNTINFTGIVPTKDYRARFGLIVSGGKAGQLLPAVICGEFWIKVDIVDEYDRFAEAKVGETKHLQSAKSGSAQILWAEAGKGVKWAYVRLGNYPDELIRFRLRTKLPLGGYGTAIELQRIDGVLVEVGEEFEVKDFTTPGSWKGKVNAEGWCHRKLDGGFHEIVWMQMLARFAEATLTQDMGVTNPNEATATIGNYWHIINPGETVKVHDPQQLFRRAKSGAKCVVVWDEKRDDAQEGDDPSPYYVVIECETQAGEIRGTLTADFTAGASPGANVSAYGGSQQDVQNPGTSVTLYDPQLLFLRARAGAKYFATYDCLENKYIAIECQSQAGGIDFTLTASLASGSATVTVNRFYGSQQDVQEPSGTITVYDEQGIFPRGRTGAKGVAIYDAEANKYRVVICQQLAITAKATLGADLCGGGTATISGFEVTSPSPFNQVPDPLPTSVANPFKHRGKSGKAVWLAWDNSSAGEWVIIDIEKVEAKAMVGISSTGPLRINSGVLEGYMATIAIEQCADPVWEALTITEPC